MEKWIRTDDSVVPNGIVGREQTRTGVPGISWSVVPLAIGRPNGAFLSLVPFHFPTKIMDGRAVRVLHAQVVAVQMMLRSFCISARSVFKRTNDIFAQARCRY